MDATAEAPTAVVARRPPTPAADRFMKRLLRVPEGGPTTDEASARSAFSTSILVSTVRCLLTYIVLPVAGPVLGLAGGVAPVVGLTVGTVSFVAIVVSMRRFWAADHRMRWGYSAIGVGIIALLAVQAVGDVAALSG